MIGILLLTNFDYDHAGELQFVVDKSWITFINSRYIVGPRRHLAAADRPDDAHRAALHHLLAGTTSPSRGNPKAFLILILILETGMIGTFVAQDLILFFVFFEVVLLPMYFMIGVWGGEQAPVRGDQVLPLHAVRLGADDRQLPGAVLPVGHGPVPAVAEHTFDMRPLPDGGGGHRRRPPRSGSSAACSWASASRCRCSRSTPGCPTPTPRRRPSGSVILAAVLLKLGTYGFIRIALPILPDAAETWAPFIGAPGGHRHHLRRARAVWPRPT